MANLVTPFFSVKRAIHNPRILIEILKYIWAVFQSEMLLEHLKYGHLSALFKRFLTMK